MIEIYVKVIPVDTWLCVHAHPSVNLQSIQRCISEMLKIELQGIFLTYQEQFLSPTQSLETMQCQCGTFLLVI